MNAVLLILESNTVVEGEYLWCLGPTLCQSRSSCHAPFQTTCSSLRKNRPEIVVRESCGYIHGRSEPLQPRPNSTGRCRGPLLPLIP
jgi:hypothetical protein